MFNALGVTTTSCPLNAVVSDGEGAKYTFGDTMIVDALPSHVVLEDDGSLIVESLWHR
jgi:hypothetical protein